MGETKQALLFSFINKYSNMIIQFGVVMVIARLLTPEEIGVYSITAAFFGFGQMIRDFGISTYIIQEKELTKDKVASAMSLSIGICFSLAAAFYFASSAIAAFYNQPVISDLLKILCFNLLFIPFGTLTLSVLKREMSFGKILTIDVISTVVYACVAITLAVYGFGVYSLAYAAFAGTAGTVFATFLFRPKWLPWLPNFKELMSVFGFGWKMSISNMLNHIHDVSGDLVLGRTLGAASVAIFNRGMSTAQLFSQLISQSVNPVLSSVMAKKNRESEGLKNTYITALMYTVILSWPFFLFISMNAELVITTLYGDQWSNVIPLLPIVSLIFALNSLFSFYGQYLVSTGLVKENLNLVFYTTVFKVSIIIGFAYTDVYTVVLAMLTLPLVRLLLIKRGLVRYLNISFGDWLPVLRFGLLTSFGVGIVTYVGSIIAEDFNNHVMELLFLAFLSAIVWLAVLVFYKHPCYQDLIKPSFRAVLNKFT